MNELKKLIFSKAERNTNNGVAMGEGKWDDLFT
jgi:hypothetical protein